MRGWDRRTAPPARPMPVVAAELAAPPVVGERSKVGANGAR
jgi:hypothetical protein